MSPSISPNGDVIAYTKHDGVYIFEYLMANNFKLRLVYDRNNNRQWDTGDYLKRIQPEKVIIYPEEVESRLNWEVEVIWNLSSP
jgi:hypothetical protein